jgi:hypothetical protein
MASHNITLISLALILFSFSWFKNDNGKCLFAKDARWWSIAFLSVTLGEWCSIVASAELAIPLIGAISMFLIGFELSLAILGAIVNLLPPQEFKVPPRLYWIALQYVGFAILLLLIIWVTGVSQISLWKLSIPVVAFLAFISLIKWLSKNGKKAD